MIGWNPALQKVSVVRFVVDILGVARESNKQGVSVWCRLQQVWPSRGDVQYQPSTFSQAVIATVSDPIAFATTLSSLTSSMDAPGAQIQASSTCATTLSTVDWIIPKLRQTGGQPQLSQDRHPWELLVRDLEQLQVYLRASDVGRLASCCRAFMRLFTTNTICSVSLWDGTSDATVQHVMDLLRAEQLPQLLSFSLGVSRNMSALLKSSIPDLIKLLGSCQHLSVLDLRLQDFGSDEASVSFVQTLRQPGVWPRLRSLYLWHTLTDRVGAVVLLEALMDRRCGSLNELSLGRLAIEGAGMGALGEALRQPGGGLSQLRKLVLTGCTLDAADVAVLAEVLCQSGSRLRLQTLSLDDNSIGDAGAEALARTLCQPGAWSSLRTLDVSSNQIGAEGAKALAMALQQPSTCPLLHTLNLRHNRLEVAGTKAIMEALYQSGSSKQVQTLDLGSNSIGTEGAGALARTLCQPGAWSSLRTLDVSYNQVGAEGGKALAMALQQPSTCPLLDTLCLVGNHLGPPGAEAIVGALCQGGSSRRLKTLTLDENGIGDAGAEALARALYEPGLWTRLQYLGLCANDIGDAGAGAFGRALEQPGVCSQLQLLHLDDNRIGDEGARALLRAVQQPEACPQLMDVFLFDDSRIAADLMEELKEALARPRLTTTTCFLS